MRQSETIPFPSRVVLQREERMLDRVRSVTLVGWLPVPRVRIVTAEGGVDHRWLAQVNVLFCLPSGQICARRFSQWRDDALDNFVATLGMRCEGMVVASRCLPPLGYVAFVSGSHVRFFPLSAP